MIKKSKASKDEHDKWYPLSDVKACVFADPPQIKISDQALAHANRDFGFDADDILDILKNLNGNQAKKKNICMDLPQVSMNHYHVPFDDDIIYLHFYIDPSDGYLNLGAFRSELKDLK